MNAAPPQPTNRPSNRPRRRKLSQQRRDRRIAFIVGVVAAAVVVLVIVVAVPASEHRNHYELPTTTTLPSSVRYMGYDVSFYPDLPVNELDPEAFFEEDGLLHYDDGVTASEPGIDVSDHQGDINWRKVAAAGIRFAFLRIGYRGYTEGGLYPDERFEDNYAAARANDIQVGVYFYSQAVSVTEAVHEAEYVLELLDKRKLDLPVIIDWEFADSAASTARTDDVNGELLTAISAAFCSRIQRDGYTAGIYFNKDTGYVHYDLSELSAYPFWIADYNATPVFYYAHEYWQYTDKGEIDGISIPVDLNIRFVRRPS